MFKASKKIIPRTKLRVNWSRRCQILANLQFQKRFPAASLAPLGQMKCPKWIALLYATCRWSLHRTYKMLQVFHFGRIGFRFQAPQRQLPSFAATALSPLLLGWLVIWFLYSRVTQVLTFNSCWHCWSSGVTLTPLCLCLKSSKNISVLDES